MRIFLDQIGCRLNYSEMDTLAGQLRAAGHLVVSAPEQAQVIVFNSCAVTTQAGRKSRQRIRSYGQANAQARIAVTGCWAALQPADAAQLPGVALVADNGQKALLPSLLEPWSAELDDPDDLARMQPSGTPFAALNDGTPFAALNGGTPFAALNGGTAAAELLRTARTRAFIKVQDGCDNRCTFCIVTVARGPARSRTLAEIIHEVQQCVADGVQEIVLTGVHLGSFGRDLSAPTDLKQLTSALLTQTAAPRIRLSSLEPWELVDGFFDLWQRWPDRLCPHLHVPLQAGTDQQLRRMARRCTTASFRQLVNEARATIPDLVLTTDLIVGFPGEREADFADGLAFVEEMRFADAHIFPFSARAGTAAASFGDMVPKAVKKERSQRMHALIEHTGRSERQRFVGQVRPVLWEGAGQQLADCADLLWTGFTDNYLRVTTVAPAKFDLHNVLTPTRLDELHGDTFHGTLDRACIACG